MKNRILLFLFYQFVAIVSLIAPSLGLEILTDHLALDKRRKEAQRAAGAVRVGDRV